MASIDENNILTLLNRKIKPGQSAKINFNTAKLYTTTAVEVPIIVERSTEPGPVVLITGGIHGDEINGVEIVRQTIAKGINKPAKGTIICIPVVNVFGFLNLKREFPDGRDLNYDQYFSEGTVKPSIDEYNSNNTKLLSIDEMKNLLMALPQIKEDINN